MTATSYSPPPRNAAAGLLKPLLGKLQLRALRIVVIFGVVFLGGLILFLIRLTSLLTPDLRASLLSVDGVPSTLFLALLWLVGSVIVTSAIILSFIKRHVSGPAAELARIHEAVAGGDLSVAYAPGLRNAEVDRLSGSTVAMLSHLRSVAGDMRDATTDNSRLTAQIALASQSVAASAREGAATSSVLSRDVTQRERAVHELATGATRLGELSGEIRVIVGEGMKRDRALRTVAVENRVRLDETSAALESLTTNALASAEAIEGLSSAVDEIRAFLSLVQKISRQSKLLALNAAMEAARAGEHGEGFAVVATEVRRLASSSAEAAERTTSLVKEMLERVQSSRESTTRTVTTVQQVLESTRAGRKSFADVEEGVLDAQGWSEKVENTVAETGQLIDSMTQRINTLAQGTSAFARAIHHVASTRDEQSRGLSDLASSATELSDASRRLTQLAATFRLSSSPRPAAFPTA
ncbi:MAG: methyl-accepting chemotaxis protein [Gemmatimonadaceae bacterium]|nr:methyl-accepting chemotaxis protein [Gemmatimonadaceae bacterium]